MQRRVTPWIKLVRSCSVTDKHFCQGSEPHFQSKGIWGGKGFPNNLLLYIARFKELLLPKLVGIPLEGGCDFWKTVILHGGERSDFAKFLPYSVVLDMVCYYSGSMLAYSWRMSLAGVHLPGARSSFFLTQPVRAACRRHVRNR